MIPTQLCKSSFGRSGNSCIAEVRTNDNISNRYVFRFAKAPAE